MTEADSSSQPASATLDQEARQLVQMLADRGLMIATAESCTGGLIAATLTDVPGASTVLDRGFVTYSNAAKSEILGVPARLIAEHGAVSAPVAVAMAEGALRQSTADLAVSVTGIAGPGGATAGKPIGLVHFAVAQSGQQTVEDTHWFGDVGRAQVRRLSVAAAFRLIRRSMSNAGDP